MLKNSQSEVSFSWLQSQLFPFLVQGLKNSAVDLCHFRLYLSNATLIHRTHAPDRCSTFHGGTEILTNRRHLKSLVKEKSFTHALFRLHVVGNCLMNNIEQAIMSCRMKLIKHTITMVAVHFQSLLLSAFLQLLREEQYSQTQTYSIKNDRGLINAIHHMFVALLWFYLQLAARLSKHGRSRLISGWLRVRNHPYRSREKFWKKSPSPC